MDDPLCSSPNPDSEAGAPAPPSTAEQLQLANQQLSAVNRELDISNEQLRVANEQLRVANEQLRVYNEEIRAQATKLLRSEEVVQQLNTELLLINAGLVDTIADSLQATEYALAEAEAQRQRLHRLLAEAPTMIAVLTGPAHVVELANDHFRALLGSRELVGQPFGQAVPELAGQPFLAQLAEVYRTGHTYTGTDVPLALGGPPAGPPAPLFATYIIQATRGGAGYIDGLLVFAYEVTEQVLARHERETSARQRQLVTDALPVLIAYVDQAQRYQFNNQAYESWFQQSPAALRGQRVRDVVGEAAYAAAQPYLVRALAGEAVEFEARMPYRAGFVKHIHTRFVPDVQQGEVAGCYCLVSDITEQVAARLKIERQQQQLHSLFMAAPGPIVILDGPALVFALVNPAYQQIFPGRELLGQPLLAALPELADTPIPGLIQQVYATGQTYVAEELPLQLARHAAGPPEEIWWTFTYQARRNAQGTVDGVVVFAADVTSQVRARQAAEASNQHLARRNAELDAFVYAASHDLQGPLDNIAGLLQILHGALPDADQPALVTRILGLLHDSAGRFRHTLAQLSTIARAQAEVSPPAALITLADVVQGVLLDLALPIAEAGAHITVDVAACPPVSLPEKNLRSVVYNLLSNAVKYRHPDRAPQVRVQGRLEAGFCVLEVQDNGIGLALPAGEPAFNLFQRFRTHVNGSGVGLYLVQKLVERDGGRLEVTSQLGQGSTFTVYFNC